MTQSLEEGIALTLVAGLLSGNCLLPMKFHRHWRWENAWFVFSIVSLIILPWALGLTLVSHLWTIYTSLPATAMLVPFLFGAGWGIAQVLFGISVDRLGLSLAYAIIVGLGALLGTLIPLFAQHRAEVSQMQLVLIFSGVAFMMTGITLCAWGGQLREGRPSSPGEPAALSRYYRALLVAILCGLMAPMLNYALAFGEPIARQSALAGNAPLRAAYAVWPIALAGGFLPNIIYSIFLIEKNRSWPRFCAPAPDLLLSTSMGALWMGAFALYGMSVAYLGELGTSIGWGLFQIFMIATATLSGVITGEWKDSPRRARQLLLAGLCCLAAATTLLAMGNR